MSSLETRTCYVMQIVDTSSCYTAIKEETSDSEEAINKDNSASSVTSTCFEKCSPVSVYIKSISEFPLSSGILSFSIVDAAVRRYKCANDNYMCEELDDYDEETSSIYCVVVHMYVIQAKSMQECHILYQPNVPENVDVRSTISSSDTSALSRSNTSDKSVPNTNENNERTIDDEDDEVEVLQNEKEVKELSCNIPLIKEEFSANKQNALELLLDIASSSNVSSTVNIATSSGGSTVVAVAAAAAAAPSVIATENKVDSRNPSPKVSTANKSYPQLNLMTPDAFTSTSSTNNGMN